MKTREGIIKLSEADFIKIGGTANIGAFTTDKGYFIVEGYRAHKEYLKLLANRKTYKRF